MNGLRKKRLLKQPTLSLLLMLFGALITLVLIPIINNTRLTYVPRAQEAVDEGVGIDSPGTSGPIANSEDFNCELSNNTCAEEIPCGYCRQHDSDCRMYLCVGPDYPRPNLPTYAFSVYMPYSDCPKPDDLKSTCTTVVSWDESVETIDENIEVTVKTSEVAETVDGHTIVNMPKLGNLMIE